MRRYARHRMQGKVRNRPLFTLSLFHFLYLSPTCENHHVFPGQNNIYENRNVASAAVCLELDAPSRQSLCPLCLADLRTSEIRLPMAQIYVSNPRTTRINNNPVCVKGHSKKKKKKKSVRPYHRTQTQASARSKMRCIRYDTLLIVDTNTWYWI